MYPRSSFILKLSLAGVVALALSAGATAQSTAAAPAPAAAAAVVSTPPADQPAPPAPLTTPAVTGPLQWLPPAMFDAGPLGKIAANGIVTGSGLVQSNHVPGDDIGQAALSNGQIF